MPKHYKPSKEELQAGIDASLKELDATPPTPTPEPKADPQPPTPEPPKADPEPKKPEETKTPEATPPTPETPTPDPDVDFKKKFSESSREAQVQGFKLKAINEAYEEASKITDVTEEELVKSNPEWEDMTDTEKRFAKQILINQKKNDLVNGAIAKFKDVDQWTKQVDDFVTDPKVLIAHPELEGKESDFKNFASKPTRRGVDMDDLLLAFSGEQAKLKPAPKKGEMFPTGSGGVKTAPPPSDGKISAMEGRSLMKSDYKKWKEMLTSGKIRNE